MGRLNSIAFKYPLAGAVLVCLSVTLVALLIQDEEHAQLERAIGQEILGIAATGALLIDPIKHEDIFRDDQGDVGGREEFDQLKAVLERISRVNGLTRPVYTLRRAADFGQTRDMEFVVMTNLGPDGKPYVGNRIPTNPFIEQAYVQGKPVSTPLYNDAHGTWISGLAPVKGKDGQIVAILSIDQDVQFFLAALARVRRMITKAAVVATLIGGLVFGLAARRTVAPLETLARFSRAIAAGDLKQRTGITRGDEIGQLARSFDEMCVQLAIAQEQQKERERIRLELSMASEMQVLLMPSEHLETAGLSLAGGYRPAAELGGDFYGWIGDPRSGDVLLLLGDVTGHGFSQALVTASAVSYLRQLESETAAGELCSDPTVVLTGLNDRLWRMTRGAIQMTACCLVFHRQAATVTVASAAHASPLRFRAGEAGSPKRGLKDVEALISPKGVRLGECAVARFEARDYPTRPGDLVLVYTDGLLDAARPDGQKLGKRTLCAELHGRIASTPPEISAALASLLERHLDGGVPEDDVAWVVGKIEPEAPAPVVDGAQALTGQVPSGHTG